jgi:hypothetical protein
MSSSRSFSSLNGFMVDTVFDESSVEMSYKQLPLRYTRNDKSCESENATRRKRRDAKRSDDRISMDL